MSKHHYASFVVGYHVSKRACNFLKGKHPKFASAKDASEFIERRQPHNPLKEFYAAFLNRAAADLGVNNNTGVYMSSKEQRHLIAWILGMSEDPAISLTDVAEVLGVSSWKLREKLMFSIPVDFFE